MVGLDTVAYAPRRGDAAGADAHRALQRQDRWKGRHADPCRARRLPEIGRSESRLLAERSRAARDQCGAIEKSPAETFGRTRCADAKGQLNSKSAPDGSPIRIHP